MNCVGLNWLTWLLLSAECTMMMMMEMTYAMFMCIALDRRSVFFSCTTKWKHVYFTVHFSHQNHHLMLDSPLKMLICFKSFRNASKIPKQRKRYIYIK